MHPYDMIGPGLYDFHSWSKVSVLTAATPPAIFLSYDSKIIFEENWHKFPHRITLIILKSQGCGLVGHAIGPPLPNQHCRSFVSKYLKCFATMVCQRYWACPEFRLFSQVVLFHSGRSRCDCSWIRNFSSVGLRGVVSSNG